MPALCCTCFAYEAQSASMLPLRSVSTPLKVYPKSMSSSITSSFTARNRGTCKPAALEGRGKGGGSSGQRAALASAAMRVREQSFCLQLPTVAFSLTDRMMEQMLVVVAQQ